MKIFKPCGPTLSNFSRGPERDIEKIEAPGLLLQEIRYIQTKSIANLIIYYIQIGIQAL